MDRYDIGVIGSGPAGLSAAVNSKIRNKKVVVFGSKDLSTKLIKAPVIDNYLGLHEITGIELKTKFEQHINAMEIPIVYERINAIYAMGDYFTLMVNDNAYEASGIILATGIEYAKPIEGEEKFLGKGVGYCATCDAPLYRGKKVVVVSHSKHFEEEANFVSELAGKLYYIPLYKGEYGLKENIEVVSGRPVSILGTDRVNKLKLNTGEIDADGIFILKDSVPPGQLVPGLEIENGHIKVDRTMKTNIEGCYAAGDCIGKPYQFIKAAGEGQVAALNLVSYLDSK